MRCTEVLYVPINAEALQKLVEEKGDEDAGPENGGRQHTNGRGVARKSVADLVQQLREAVEHTSEGEPKVDEWGRWTLRLAYKNCEKGRDLIEAGHVTGAREYAVGTDPFKWSKRVRECALEGGGDGVR